MIEPIYFQRWDETIVFGQLTEGLGEQSLLLGGFSTVDGRDSFIFASHQNCQGHIHLMKTGSIRRKLLVCDGCALQIEIPYQIKTYAELRKFAQNTKTWRDYAPLP